MTTRSRYWRRRCYNVFSHFYDPFIQMHARKDDAGTRSFLADSASLSHVDAPLGLDICCGTGAVLLALANRYPRGWFVGYDFSHGMLRAARGKDSPGCITFVQGNAAALPFTDNTFHVVSCSHASYELKGGGSGRGAERNETRGSPGWRGADHGTCSTQEGFGRFHVSSAVSSHGIRRCDGVCGLGSIAFSEDLPCGFIKPYTDGKKQVDMLPQMSTF